MSLLFLCLTNSFKSAAVYGIATEILIKASVTAFIQSEMTGRCQAIWGPWTRPLTNECVVGHLPVRYDCATGLRDGDNAYGTVASEAPESISAGLPDRLPLHN